MTTTPRTSFRLSAETLAELDRRRGSTTRTEYVRRMIHAVEVPVVPMPTEEYVERTWSTRDPVETVVPLDRPIDLRRADVEPRPKSGKR